MKMKFVTIAFFLAFSASSSTLGIFAIAFHAGARASVAEVSTSPTSVRMQKRCYSVDSVVKCCALPDQISEKGNDTFSRIKGSTNKLTSTPHHRKVAILLPELTTECDNDDSAKWHSEAIAHLENISHCFGLPFLDITLGDEIEESMQYSHYLTAVSYPRTHSFALAIHHTNPLTSKNSRRSNKRKKVKKLNLDPLFVDLCPPPDTRLGYRVNKNNDGGGGELLLKALGAKKMLAEKSNGQGHPLIIYDLTAGLARDSLIILSSFLANYDLKSLQPNNMPLRLHMVERDPVVATLLQDAMRRLDLLSTGIANNEHLCSQVTERENNTARQLTKCLSMEEGDGVSVLNRLMLDNISSKSEIEEAPYPPDVVYLDPMFPPRKKKSSAVKKDMAMLHSLLGTAVENPCSEHNKDDAIGGAPSTKRMEEEQALLLAAYNSATRRVVVKRPIGAQPLGLPPREKCKDEEYNKGCDIPNPSYDIRGSVNRFDVYIKQ